MASGSEDDLAQATLPLDRGRFLHALVRGLAGSLEDIAGLADRACLFGDQVLGRSSMCMMTSNVFGSSAVSSLGDAKVELPEAMARGHPGCRVLAAAVDIRPEGST